VIGFCTVYAYLLAHVKTNIPVPAPEEGEVVGAW